MATVCAHKRHRRTVVHNSLEVYLRQIDGVPLLTDDEEKAIALRVSEGDSEARDQMILANLRLVINLARRYSCKGLSLQDLVEEGNIGLIRAVDRFDLNKGTRFSTYATFWIKQAMIRALANTTRMIRIPVYMFDLLIKWQRTERKLSETLGRAPTSREIATSLQLPRGAMELVKEAQRITTMQRNSDDPVSGFNLEETLEDERADTLDAEIENEETTFVMNVLDEMDEREANILRMRFGLNNTMPKTLKEIGDLLGLSRERIRQIENEAIHKIALSLTA